MALQIGHRVSVDLDLFGNRPFESLEILDELSDLAPLSIMTSKHILILDVQGVKVDFVNYRYPLVAEPLLVDGLRLLTLPDIGAMKLAAIAGRGRKRDFYDLFFLLQQFNLEELMGFYRKKYDDGSEFMVARSIVYFDDADQDDDIRLLGKQVKWETVKKTIQNLVKEKYQ